MTARFVLVCDVCGAITDDHYPYPVARARKLARALGYHYRKKATTSGDYRASDPSYHRFYVDLCPEHTYSFDLNRVPVRMADWRSRWHRDGPDPQPMHPQGPEPVIRYDNVAVTYQYGEGPYRLYADLVRQLREAGVTRAQLERLRREMFAPGAEFLKVAAQWAVIDTEEET